MGTAAGQILKDTDFAALPGKLVAYGLRNTNSSTTTTEQGVIRLDSVPVTSGHRYVLVGAMNGISTVSTDLIAPVLHINTSGTATTASPTVGSTFLSVVASGNYIGMTITTSYLASSTGTVSILLTIKRNTGTGTINSGAPAELFIWDAGTDPTSTVTLP